ncbi:protocadherin beta-16-like isoform X16 [Hemibagrus wyckioides]|uniref:protocadherin beta-16-like isoform X16 n=1 Tax=Hemibagrus wyckioides TaxID=337641 RepID=UPI00266BB0AC|nr:protocadherin beta-16-like isoform X16 [Hemibagrus wyckioides]
MCTNIKALKLTEDFILRIFCIVGKMADAVMWQTVLFFILISSRSVLAQVSYSIPEEMSKGSIVGNIAQDLGLDIKRLKSGKARIYTVDSTEYIELNRERGSLLIKEKIDRESLCAKKTPCALHLQMILESPMERYTITIEITDINDNAPLFTTEEIRIEISESAVPGARFMLEKAMDADVGTNGLQSYSIKPTDHFVLDLQNHADGDKSVEMILQKPLDREKQETFTLLLTAMDGGEPVLSGTVQIHVIVLDANDNAPVFKQKLYRATLTENAAKGTKLITVSASDADEGSNGRVTYYMSKTVDRLSDLFVVDQYSGEVILNGQVDFEKTSNYQVEIQAKDQGGLSDSCKVVIEVLDINDNTPSIKIISMSNSISEESNAETVVAMINVNDPDSGENGKVQCIITDNIPFIITSSSNNFFSLQTDQELDREREAEYNITVTCSDEGVPSLSSSTSLRLHISDVNDNAPVFERNNYQAYVVENNTPGLSIFTVKASDADSNQNARVSYILEESTVNGLPVSSYVSVSADSGAINAVRSFDYEQLKDFNFHVKAQDGGSPPLSSTVTVKITVQDQNDNAPQVLYPVQTSGSVVAEIVPRSADVGYLVTKVVAVDVDSGQNAWLSYKLQKATDRALFEVGMQNGEIRTVRQVTDKDVVKQKLTVVVEDNGQPSRSAVVNINVAVADTFPEVLSEFTDFTQTKQYNDDLTFYLVLALAAVSFLFITTVVVIISVKIYRWRQSRIFYQSNLPVIPYYPPGYTDTGVTGTLPHTYNYDACMTTDSRKSACKYSTLGGQSVLMMDPSFTETMHHKIKENILLEDPDSAEMQKPPNNDWRLPPNQRPGPSGAGARPEEAGAGAVVGTGPWPNPPTEAEQLQALMAAANEVSEATATLGPRYNAQYVADYRQNVYIPGSTATLTANPQQQMPQQALPPPQAPPQAAPAVDVPKAAPTPASKKKVTKKDKK